MENSLPDQILKVFVKGYSAKVILYYHSGGIINFSSGSYSEIKMAV